LMRCESRVKAGGGVEDRKDMQRIGQTCRGEDTYEEERTDMQRRG
jgi:hypothetical protein